MAHSLWGQLNEDVMSGATVWQAHALAEIAKAFNPNPMQEVWMYEEVMREAGECGHRWGEPCDCPMCERNRPILEQMITQFLAMQQAEMQGQASG